MSTKLTGLAAFTKRGSNQLDAPQSDGQTSSPERQRAKKDVVALTVRLQRAEWERLHQLAVFEGMSIQSLAVRGLIAYSPKKDFRGLRKGTNVTTYWRHDALTAEKGQEDRMARKSGKTLQGSYADKLIDAAVDIRMTPDAVERSYMARQLVRCAPKRAGAPLSSSAGRL